MLNDVSKINFYNEEYPVNWLVISDLHILPKEPKNRKSLIPNIITLLNELIEIGIQNKISGIIFLGDIFDRSFTSVNSDYLAQIMEIFKRMSESFPIYAVYGNHELTYFKDNPYYLMTDIQSQAVLSQLKGKTVPKCISPYIKVIDSIDYGNVIINFVHFQKYNKFYKIACEENKINVALYHDSLINFESKEKLYHHKIGKGIDVVNTDIFEFVDWAICGDTHTPLNTFTLGNNKSTVFDVPGVMSLRTTADKHTHVKCPIISIGPKGLKRQYISLNIGVPDETVENQDKLNDEKAKRKLATILKKIERDDTFSRVSYEDFMNTLDPTERELLSNPNFNMQSEIMYYNINNNKQEIIK